MTKVETRSWIDVDAQGNPTAYREEILVTSRGDDHLAEARSQVLSLRREGRFGEVRVDVDGVLFSNHSRPRGRDWVEPKDDCRIVL